jgi:hypothetical protein
MCTGHPINAVAIVQAGGSEVRLLGWRWGLVVAGSWGGLMTYWRIAPVQGEEWAGQTRE